MQPTAERKTIMSGMGVERDEALRVKGLRRPTRTYVGIGKPESKDYLLGLSKACGHDSFVEGDLVSVDPTGKIVPLDPALPFAGIIRAIGQDNLAKWFARVYTRCAISERLENFSPDVHQGVPVFAIPGPNRTHCFTADAWARCTPSGRVAGIQSSGFVSLATRARSISVALQQLSVPPAEAERVL